MKTKIKRKTEIRDNNIEKEKNKTEYRTKIKEEENLEKEKTEEKVEVKELEDLIDEEDDSDGDDTFDDLTVVEVNKDEDKSIEKLQECVEGLRKQLEEKNVTLHQLEKELHEMNSTIQKYQDGGSGDEIEEVENGDKYLNDKDSLVFHGVETDLVEEQMQMDDADIKKNFMDQRIRDLLMEKWDLDCTASFKHVFRLLFYPIFIIHCYFDY